MYLLPQFPGIAELTCPQETEGHPAEESGVHVRIRDRMKLSQQWFLIYSSKEFPQPHKVSSGCDITVPATPTALGHLPQQTENPWSKCLASCLLCYMDDADRLHTHVRVLREIEVSGKHKKKWKREKE